MSLEMKKTIYWTTGALVGLVVLVAVLWFAGVIQAPPVQ